MDLSIADNAPELFTRCEQELGPIVALGGIVPLNPGYRHRKAMDGDFRRAEPFVPPEKPAASD